MISKDGTIKQKYSVLIPNRESYTLCLSSQIGCPVGCIFCLSGTSFERNLTKEEIIEQYKSSSHKPSRLVFMGMGEPLLNYGSVKDAILHFNKTHLISRKKILLSTVGLPLLHEILENKPPFMLAISLHASNDKLRKKLIPNTIPIKEIVELSNKFSKMEKFGTMIEYILVKELNDQDSHLEELLSLPWEKNTFFNLIELNETNNLDKSTRINYWKEKIINSGFKCFIRNSTGADIMASCGLVRPY